MKTRHRYDVFLSHNSREKPVVERIAEKLRMASLEPWLDKWCLAQGGQWQQELAAGLRESSACAVFVGPSDVGDWEREEIALALNRAATDRDFRLFLVFLPGLPEPFDVNSLSPFLSTRTWVDLRQGFESARRLQPLVNAIKGVPSGPPEPTRAPGVCPYRGLQTFDEEHAEFFFGRDADIQRLVEKLKATRFLIVLGPSGSGKSSLVRAGLVPALRNGVIPGSHEWPIRILTPGSLPLSGLARELLRSGPPGSMQATLDGLATDPRSLHLAATLALEGGPAERRQLWVIDQFEEAFTLCTDETERRQFVANFLYAASVPGGSCVVLLTMRADFYGKCSAYPELAARVATHQFLVSPMDGESLRQVVVAPAERVGLEFEEGLVDTILDAVLRQPGSLPLLEHALLELWERRRGQMLTLEGYRESGGVEGAIARRADSTYEGFSPEQQAVARRIMLRLTQVGEGTEDTRRRARMSELVTTPTEADAVESVVRALADARLLTTMAEVGPDERGVEVSHEALIRAWPRLRKWIDEDRAGLRLHRQVAEAAEAWRRLNRDEGALFRGARLAQALEWRVHSEAELNEGEREFLDAGKALRDREIAATERRHRRQMITMAAGLAAALAVSIVIAALWRRARAQEDDAVARGAIAAADLSRSRSLATAPGWPDLLERSVLLAIEGWKLRPSPESEQSLRAGVDLLGRSTTSLDGGGIPLFSPDGTFLAVAGEKRVQVWDTRSREIRVAVDSANKVKAFAFSPGSGLLAVVTDGDSSDREALEVWTLAEGRRLWSTSVQELRGWAQLSPSVFSPNDESLAVIDGNRALVLEARTGREQARISHGAAISGIAFSADGSRLATGSRDRTARVTVVGTGGFVTIKHTDEIGSVAMSDDARLLLTTSGGAADVWDLASGRHVVDVPGLSGEHAFRASFSSDGGSFGIIGEYGNAQLWSVSLGTQLWGIVHAGDGRRIGSLGARHVGLRTEPGVEVWDVTTGKPAVRVIHRGSLNEVEAFAFNQPSGRLALADDEHVWIYDTEAGSEVTRVAYENPDWHVVRSPDRKTVAVLAGATVALWDVAEAREGGRFAAGGTLIHASFSLDRKYLVTETSDHLMQVWDAALGKEAWRGTGIGRAILNREGTLLATTGRDATVRMWTMPGGRELWRHDGIRSTVVETDSDDEDVEVANVLDAGFSRDGKHLVLHFRDETVRAWEATSGREISEIDPLSFASWIAPTDAGPFVFAARAGGGVEVWGSGAASASTLLPHPGELRGFFASPSGAYLATVVGGEVRLWEAGSARPVGSTKDEAYVQDLAFSPDELYFATVTWGPSATLMETRGAREVARLTHDANPDPKGNGVTRAEFSRDSQYVVTAGQDKTARVWEVPSGRERARLAHDGPVVLAAFSGDGRHVTTWSDDRRVRVWLWRDRDLVEKACERLTRNLTKEEWGAHFGGRAYSKTCPSLP